MYQLFYPLKYLMLRSDSTKWSDALPLVIITLVITLPFMILDGVSFFHPNGFLDKTLTLTSCLTGFYIAALVAAATMNHPDLDDEIQIGTVYISRRDEAGSEYRETLTRREFACSIFGYLSFSSLLISLASAYMVSISGVNLSRISSMLAMHRIPIFNLWYIFRAVAIITMNGAVSHLFIVTCTGLYYMMDRLFRHNIKVIGRKRAA